MATVDDLNVKHEEDLQRLRGFRLLDDDFMTKVFEDKGCAELLLKIILGRNDIRVVTTTPTKWHQEPPRSICQIRYSCRR